MLAMLAKLGVSGGVGVLLGLVAVWWVRPTTSSGTTLLIAVFVVITTVVGGILSRFFGKTEDPVDQVEGSETEDG